MRERRRDGYRTIVVIEGTATVEVDLDVPTIYEQIVEPDGSRRRNQVG
jgi:hypothetical protein